MTGLLGALAATRLSRLRRDAALVLALAGTAGLSAAYSQAAPHLATASVDAAAVQAVAAAGSEADLIVEASVGAPDPNGYEDPPAEPAAFLTATPALVDRLPADLRTHLGRPTTAVVAPPHDAERSGTGPALTVRLAVADARAAPALVPRDRSGDDGVAVVVPRVAATAAGLSPGDELLLQPSAGAAAGDPLRLRVVGDPAPTVRVRDALDAVVPGASGARRVVAFGRPAGLEIVAFTSPADALRASKALAEPWSGAVRLPRRPATFDAASLAATAARSSRSDPVSADGVTATLRSGFGTALAGFPDRAAAALALQRYAATGALAAGLLTLLLLGSAIAGSRAEGVAVERVRGLSLGQAVVRALVEALPAVVAAVAVGAALGGAPHPGPPHPLPLVVIAVAALAAPVGAEARLLLPPGREGSRRIVLEVALVALAALAVAAVSTAPTDPDDPLLVAAPVLTALAVAVLARRLAAAAAVALRPMLLRSRTALPALVTAAPPSGGSGLIAIAVATSIAVGGAVVVADLDAGRVAGSWSTVGGDARVDGPLVAGAAERAAARPGVTAAASASVDPDAALTADDATVTVTLTGVDRRWGALLAATPARPSAADRSVLGRLDAAGTLPIAVSPDLADRASRGVRLEVGDRTVAARVVGVVDAWPTADLQRRGVLADAERLAAATGGRDDRDLLLAVGPGAEEALAGTPGRHLDRTTVLAAARAEALPAGIGTAFGAAAWIAAVLALLALAAGLRRAAPLRRQEAGLLAVLGLPTGTRRRLLLARTAPAVLLAVLAGAVTGAGTVRLLAGPLGVQRLAGATGDTAAAIPVLAAALAAASVAVALAALLEPGGGRRRTRSTTGDPA